jgi:hypothetical protein
MYGNRMLPFNVAIRKWYIMVVHTVKIDGSELFDFTGFFTRQAQSPLCATILPNAFCPGDYVRLAISA